MMKFGFKKIGCLLFTLLFVITSSGFNSGALASSNELETVSEYIVTNPYVYPITPLTTPVKWKSFQSHDEMIEACQIPDDVLHNLTTPQLVKACLDYPLSGDVLQYNSYDTGFQSQYRSFNGLQELFKRQNFASELTKLFLSLDLSDLTETEFLPSYKFRFINVLISQDAVVDALTNNEKEAILAKSQSLQDNIRNKYQNIFVQDDIANASQRIASSMVDTSSPITPYDYSTTVQTQKGTDVPAIKVTTELSSEDYQEALNWINTTYPNATILRNPTKKYNCHSYAWYSQSSSNTIWIDRPNQRTWWEDGSWVRTTSSPVRGMKVDYYSSDHSAIVYNASIYDSKWGANCLVRHTPSYCPYSSSTRHFYDAGDWS